LFDHSVKIIAGMDNEKQRLAGLESACEKITGA
jgi:hypothetical protein